MPTMKGANAHSVRMVIALMATVRNVLLTIVKAVIVRIVLASITITKEANARSVLTTAKVVLMIVLNVLPTIVKVVIVRIVLASIVAKVEAIAATTVVAIVRDSIMTVRAVTVLVHVPAIMTRMLNIA